eukprot:3450193-Pleurochrysis_carterae.AAC.1
MSLPAGMLSSCVPTGEAGRALAGLADAVRAAVRAGHTVAALETLTHQPQAVDFGALDLAGWKRWSALSLFRGRDGAVWFTDGRTPAAHHPSDGGMDVSIRATALGGTATVRADTLLSDSNGVLPAVLSFGGRTGELGRTLR